MTFDEIIQEKLWAVRYVNEEDNELARLFKEWNRVNDLYVFFKKNCRDLSYFNVSVDQAVMDTLEDRDQLERKFLDWHFNLDTLFRPLDNRVGIPGDMEKMKGRAKRRIHPSWLRVYALRLADGKYIITGGAIKLTEKMDEREHLKRELVKIDMDNVLNKLRSLSSPNPSCWREEAESRQAKMSDLRNARMVALGILKRMDKENITVQKLAVVSGFEEGVIFEFLQADTAIDPVVLERMEDALEKIENGEKKLSFLPLIEKVKKQFSSGFKPASQI